MFGTEFWLVPIAFFTAAFAAVFGMGGGVLLIALMANLVPAGILIPLHAATQLASNGSRALFAWRHIDPRLMLPFFVGGVAGATLGAALIQQLDLAWLPGLVGLVILLITWLPLPQVSGRGHWAMMVLGAYQTGLGMVAGATGPLGAAVLVRYNQQRDWLVVNTAVYMCLNHAIRVAAFAVMGFSLGGWWWLLLAMVVAVVSGSWLGTRLRAYMPEGDFIIWFKLLISLLALHMIYQVL